jgi:hypothetical protein
MRYPIYVLSKSRYEYMITSRSLRRMNIPHTVAVEPQEENDYLEALKKYDLENHVTLLILPFSNHGKGGGPARNFCWEHSIELGHKRHWILDDNIQDFYRLHCNKKVRVESDAIFRASEDFADRYENLMLCGFQYHGFANASQKLAPITLNTRIQSCILIDNSCQFRWRGKYNEDVDLSLRVLKNGDCTVQFNTFIQGKMHTQALKGGNTKELYHADADESDKNNLKWGYMSSTGTIKKTQMLIDMHPDVAKVVWKFNRWHHEVDYTPFKKNQLRFKPGVQLKNEPNNYGMKFVRDYGLPTEHYPDITKI